MGLKWYRGFVMARGYYPRMDDRDHANPLCSISPSVPPADRKEPIPPPSPDQSKMLARLPPPTNRKEEEKDGSNVTQLLMDVAEDVSQDGTSTPTEEEAGTILLVPTEEEALTTQPAPTKNEAGTTLPAPTWKKAVMTLEKPTDPTLEGSPEPDWQATPSSENSSSDHNDTKDEEFVSCFVEWSTLIRTARECLTTRQ